MEAPVKTTWAERLWPCPPVCSRSENVPRGRGQCGLALQLAWSLPWRAWGLWGHQQGVEQGCLTLPSSCTQHSRRDAAPVNTGLSARVDGIAAVSVSLAGPRAAAGHLVQDSVGRPGQPMRAADEDGGLGPRSRAGTWTWSHGHILPGSAGSGGVRPAVRPAPQRGWHTAASPARNTGSRAPPRPAGALRTFHSRRERCAAVPPEPAACRELILFTYVAHVGLVGNSWGHGVGGGQAPTPSSCSGRGPPSTLTPASDPQRGGDLLSWSQSGSTRGRGVPRGLQDSPGPRPPASREGPPVRLGCSARLPRALASWLGLSACLSLNGDVTPVGF